MSSLALRIAGASDPLVGTMVLGRSPNRAECTAVRLHDPGRSSSKNHALVQGRGDLVAVTDLSSTNGTSIHVGDAVIDLRPNEQTHVTTPCTIVCGDAVVDVIVVASSTSP